MDVVEVVTSVEAIDLLVFFAVFGMFIIGFMQGTIRRLLGIASILLSLLVAAQVRAPLGSFLTENWTQYPAEYNQMIAFGAVFLAGSIGAAIAAQLFYKPVPLFPKYTIVDEILGGVLGVFQSVLILAAFFLITDPFFLTVGRDATSAEFLFIRDIHEIMDTSITASLVRDQVVPVILAVLGGIFPSAVKDVFRT
ncbi:MAG: hypothetical protein HW391_1946 [Chloroflexi bacterium]|nr:hypothetical protein [Chloroflexota bacterium]